VVNFKSPPTWGFFSPNLFFLNFGSSLLSCHSIFARRFPLFYVSNRKSRLRPLLLGFDKTGVLQALLLANAGYYRFRWFGRGFFLLSVFPLFVAKLTPPPRHTKGKALPQGLVLIRIYFVYGRPVGEGFSPLLYSFSPLSTKWFSSLSRAPLYPPSGVTFFFFILQHCPLSCMDAGPGLRPVSPPMKALLIHSNYDDRPSPPRVNKSFGSVIRTPPSPQKVGKT